MKRTATILIFLYVFVSALFAGINVEISGGFTTLSMAKYNSNFNSAADFIGIATAERSYMSSGYELEGSAFLNVLDWLAVGLKAGYIGSGQGGYTQNSTIDSTGNTYDPIMLLPVRIENKTNASLIPIMLNGEVAYDFKPAPFTIAGSLGAGYGIGLFNREFKSSFSSSSSNYINDAKTVYSGGCFMGELGIKGSYKMNENCSFSIGAAYRLANVPVVTAVSDSTVTQTVTAAEVGAGIAGDVDKGTALKDMDGNYLPLDFSGFTFRGGFTYSF